MVQQKLHLMLTFEGDPVAANYLLDEWPEGLLAQCKSHHSGFCCDRFGVLRQDQATATHRRSRRQKLLRRARTG
jgi:hypothetical protein